MYRRLSQYISIFINLCYAAPVIFLYTVDFCGILNRDIEDMKIGIVPVMAGHGLQSVPFCI
jgi:hypothetical protein